MYSSLELGTVQLPCSARLHVRFGEKIYDSYVCIAGHNECVANFEPLRSGLSEPFIKNNGNKWKNHFFKIKGDIGIAQNMKK